MPDAALVWSPDLTQYNFGPGHPMSPARLNLTHALAEELGLTSPDRVRVIEPVAVTEDELLAVHSEDYVAAVRDAQETGAHAHRMGLGLEDNPVFDQIHTASARIVGSTLAAARAVWSGESRRAFSPAGGMHHAMPAAASGFCVYNDLALAIRDLRSRGAGRVVYVDLDAHHGDGVERVFWDDPDVLTISVHEHPTTLFPGTGYPQDVGGPGARGSAVNVALPAGTGDAQWLRAVDAVVSPLVQAFAPDVVVSQHGCDSHAHDPLTGLSLSVDAQRRAALVVAELADRHAEGRWVAAGGGGYEIFNVVPRAWCHVLAIVEGRPVALETPTPPDWRTQVAAIDDMPVATSMSDVGRLGTREVTETFRPFAEGYDPADPVDRAIIATRRAVFPDHGLDPLP
jgi:acetoin utilization protein AcuC